MAESYSVKARLSAVDNGFSSTLKGASGAVDSLASKLSSGFNFGFLTGMGQQAFSALTSGVSGLVSEINSSNAAWKTFDANMGILGKGAGEIAAVKGELQSFAQSTVYSSSDMASTYAQLASVGVKSADKLVKGFGGLASAAENPQQAMKTLSTQAVQMAAKPTVAWEDFKLMLEQSPAGMSAVAKAMGMTTAELVKKIQDGEVATSDFLDTISEVGNSKDFQDMATEAKTVGQAMDGLKETVGNKLLPSFDLLSDIGIKAIDGLSSALGGIDAQELADQVNYAIVTVREFGDVLKNSFDGVGEDVGGALRAVGDALGLTNTEFSKTEALENFKSICDKVADGISAVAGFIESNSDTIAKFSPIIKGLAAGFLGLKVVNTIAPGLTTFAGSLLKMSGKGIAGLAAKLFGIAGGQKAVGAASASSGPSIMQSAVATLALGAAVLLAFAGMALLVQSAIALANAGWPAAAALAGLVVVVALLAIGAAALGPALTAGAVGFIAFGGAIALVGVGAILAAAALAIVAAVLPSIIAYGYQGALSIMALGGSMAVFAVGAGLAGMACITLGAGLLLVAAAIVVAGAGMILLGTGAILAATSLLILSFALPALAANGTEAAAAIVALGAGLVVFGAGALVAGAAALVLGAGIVVCAAGLTLAAAAAVVLGAGIMLIGTGAVMAGAGLAIVGAVLPVIAQNGASSAAALAILGAALAAFAIPATAAGVAGAALGVGFVAAAAGGVALAAAIMAVSAAIMAMSVATVLASAAIAALSMALPMLASVSQTGAAALFQISGALAVFGAGALAAGAGATVLGVGVAAAAVGIAALAVALLAMSVATVAASGAISLLSLALPMLAAVSTEGAAALALIGAALLTFGIEAAAAGAAAGLAAVGMAAFGTAVLAASAGTLVMAAAIVLVNTSMQQIAANAKSAESSLSSMQDSVSVVKSGLSALGDKAKSAMKQITNAFDDTASDAVKSGKLVGDGFAEAMVGGLMQADKNAKQGTKSVASTLRGGYSSSYSSGHYVGRGFANGILSAAGIVRSAAAQLANAATKVIVLTLEIGSPSRVTRKQGQWTGKGFALGLSDMERDVWNAAESLVSIPSVATPSFGYGGELSTDYSYSGNREYTIEVPLSVDGKEFARATATYTQDELNRKMTRDNRRHGRV